IVGCDSGVVQTQGLFHCDGDGTHRGCGQIPSCFERLRATGALPDTSVFFERSASGSLRCI
ncbi:MAG: hypothetical protein JSR15_09910, partial [Proteobacteria bacterium]|nr:hypothetical protein [Pseudomonadota bacterium]